MCLYWTQGKVCAGLALHVVCGFYGLFVCPEFLLRLFVRRLYSAVGTKWLHF